MVALKYHKLTRIICSREGGSGDYVSVTNVYKFKSIIVAVVRKYQTIIPWIFLITAFLASDSNFASAHVMGANVINKTIDNYEIRF